MQQNLFFPVYKQLEKELDELSYFITFDKKQLKTYSIKISELLLRTVSEIENISKELCKREKLNSMIKINISAKWYILTTISKNLKTYFFYQKNMCRLTQITVMKIYLMLSLFRLKDKTYTLNGKTKSIWSWYYAYNKIKHDRVKFLDMQIQNV